MSLPNGVTLLMVAVLGLLGYAWIIQPDAVRVAHLTRLVQDEQTGTPLPAVRLAQVSWVAEHRLQRLFTWQYGLVAVLVAACMEGWLWRRRQVFRGYHRMLWLWGGAAAGALLVALALFLVWPRSLPTLWAFSTLAGLILASGFALVAGFRSYV